MEKQQDSMQSLEHLEQLSLYKSYLRTHPKLVYLFLELTDVCNMSCLHCGSHGHPGNATQMPFDLAKKVLDSVSTRYHAGDIMVCLTGGEPLLHPDFFRIVTYAKACGFLCGVTTNGTCIDDTVAEKFLQSGIDTVGFSIDGTRQSHDWFRNTKGSYDRAIKGIQRITESGKLITQVTTVVHKKNISELEDIYHAICALGVGSWRVINIEPIGRARNHPDLFLDTNDLRYLFSFIHNKRQSSDTKIDVTYGCSHYLGATTSWNVREHYFICGSGLYVGSVLCNGDIYSCLDIERRPELVQGNAYRDDFVDIWENRFQIFRKDRAEECADCRACSERQFCSGDSAHTWDYDHNRPLLCLKNLQDKEDEML